MILDSCFLIDLMADDAAAAAKLDEIEGRNRPIAIPTPTVTEIERGLGSPAERRAFRTIAQDLSIVAYDHRISKRAGDVLRTLDERGEPIGTLDAMVAATALVRNDPVVTRNVDEFDRVDGLTVTPY